MKELDGRDGLIRQVLEGQRAPDPCPEADLLAAHYENELSERERLELNRHISRCARCQAHLVLIARSDTADVEPASTRAAAPRWNWTFAWTGVAATAIAVLVVWMIASRPASSPQSSVTPVTTVADSTPAPAPTNAAPPVASPAPQNPANEPKAAPLGATSTLRAEAPAERAAQRGQNAAAKGVAQAATIEKGEATRVEKQEATGVEKDKAANAERDAAAPTSERNDREARRESLQTVAPPAAPAPQAAPRAAMAFAPRSSIGTVPVSSSNGQSVWRVDGTSIRHSTDGGRTFNGQVVEGTNQLVAGSAPSPTICWMVGRQGVILRYQEMFGWERRPSPEHVDFVSVTALDLDRATVSTADGRRFRTEDGGQTWATVNP